MHESNLPCCDQGNCLTAIAETNLIWSDPIQIIQSAMIEQIAKNIVVQNIRKIRVGYKSGKIRIPKQFRRFLFVSFNPIHKESPFLSVRQLLADYEKPITGCG